jgi:hypothetical protein
MKRLLMLPLLSAAVLAGGDARAQEPSPAPSLGQKGQVAWPPVNGSSPVVIAPRSAIPSGDPSDAPEVFPQCRPYDLTVMRNDVENKRQLVETAVMRRASVGDVCKLIGDYRTAVKKMIGFAKVNGAACGAPAFADKLKISLKTIESQQEQVCTGQWPAEQRPARSPIGDFYPVRMLDMPEGRRMRGRSGDAPPADVLDMPPR